MGDRFVIGPYGEKGTVPEDQVAAVVAAGGRVLSPREKQEVEAQQAYERSSTAQKIGGAVSPLVGPIASSNLSAAGVTAVRPEVQSFETGVASGLTLGADQVAVHAALKATAGQAAADEYARHVTEAKELYPGTNLAGQGVGMLAASAGTPAGAARAIPGLGVSALGGAVEQGVGRALTGVAERGVLGRAAASAASMGARGAAEGALYGAANYTGDQLVQDHDIAAEKLYVAAGTGALGGLLAGGALGGAGSLAASGARAISTGARSTLERVLSRGEEAGVAAETKGATEAAQTAAATPTLASEPTAGSLLDNLRGQVSDKGVRDLANNRAARATGARKAFVAEADKYLPGGFDEMGEVLLRHGVIDAEGGFMAAAKNGTPEAIAERLPAPRSAVGQRLGEIVDNSGGQVPATKVIDALDSVLKPLQGKAGFRSIINSVEDYKSDLLSKLGIPEMPPVMVRGLEGYPPELQARLLEKATADQTAQYAKMIGEKTVPVKALLEQRQALDELVYREGSPLNPSPTIAEKRAIRGKMEGLVTEALDEASGKVPGELKNEYQGLKRDYQALSIAQKAAEDAASRGSANRTYSLTDKIIGTGVGAAAQVVGIPGFIAGPAAATLSKVIRERGDAAAAVLLHRAADMGIVSRAMGQVDAAMGRASKGLLTAPKARPLPDSGAAGEPTMQRAQKAMARVAEANANPEAYLQRVTKQTEGLASTAPNLASAYAATAARAMAFLASKQPPVPDADPLDPHAAPRPTPEQAHEFMRYVEYVDRPMKFFDDLERGKLTYEGAETARVLMPRAFAELQTRTAEAIANEMANGRRIPSMQREKIGLLLDMAATPSQQPLHAAFLQGNVQDALKPDTLAAQSAPPKRPAQIKTQQSALDRLEAK